MGGCICKSTLWVSIWKSLGKTNPCALDQYMIKMYLKTSTKGQLISKCLSGIFNYPKKRTKNFNFTTMVLQVELFSFVFWENWRNQKDISKLTDLYWEHSVVPELLFFLLVKGFQCCNVFCRAFSKLHHKNVPKKSIWEHSVVPELLFFLYHWKVFNVITFFSVEPFPNRFITESFPQRVLPSL